LATTIAACRLRTSSQRASIRCATKVALTPRSWSARARRSEYRCHEGLVHGFLQMTAGVRAAQRAFDELVVALRAGVLGV
jgi:hypothetical protein